MSLATVTHCMLTVLSIPDRPFVKTSVRCWNDPRLHPLVPRNFTDCSHSRPARLLVAQSSERESKAVIVEKVERSSLIISLTFSSPHRERQTTVSTPLRWLLLVTDVSSLAVPWTVPSPLAPLYAYFPLLTVSNDDDATTPAPTKPTLWVLGPPPSGHKESLDPSSRRVQALARFSNVDFDSRYLADGLGAPGGTLPSLHLPQGDLVETDRVDESILKLATTKPAASDDDDSNNKGDGGGDRSPAAADPVVQAYTSLVETTLLPAVVAAVYLVAASTPSVTPALSRPFLSDLAHRWLGIAQRRDLISDVKRLRGGKTGKDVVLDLEEVERDAVEALEALEDKFSQQDKDARWFLGAA